MSLKVGPELGVIDPVALLQDRLGVDEDQARDLASIRVKCIAPGRTDESSLGDFIASDHGAEQDAKGIVEDIAAEVHNEGASHEDAIVAILGKRAVERNEDTGALVRVTPVESKKK
jgi:hypothetical protein